MNLDLDLERVDMNSDNINHMDRLYQGLHNME